MFLSSGDHMQQAISVVELSNSGRIHWDRFNIKTLSYLYYNIASLYRMGSGFLLCAVVKYGDWWWGSIWTAYHTGRYISMVWCGWVGGVGVGVGVGVGGRGGVVGVVGSGGGGCRGICKHEYLFYNFCMGPLLLTWFNFNANLDKWLHPL